MRLPLWQLLPMASQDSSALLAKSSVSACASLMSNLTWDFVTTDEYYGAMCEYEPAIGTWATCISDFIGDQQSSMHERMLDLSIVDMNRRCDDLEAFSIPFTTDSFLDSLKNATQYLASAPTIEKPVRDPVKFEPLRRTSVGRAWVVSLRNLDASNASSIYLYGFLFFISGIAALSHYFNIATFQSKPLNILRGKYLLPTLHDKHAQPIVTGLGGLLPTRLELSLISGFLLVHAVALIYKYEIDAEETLESTPMQLLKYLGYRTGLLAFSQCPLIVFFSGRNSMYELLTGFHYTTSIVLHKWISRLMTFDAFVHGAIFILRAYWGGYLEHAARSRFWLCGALTLWASLLLCLLAFGKIRHMWYETFLVTHIILAGAFFYYAWQHVKSLGWASWVYVSVVFWALEKGLRLKRILSFGGVVRARALLYDSDIVRLAMPKPRRGWNTNPGEYVFVYFLSVTTWWQSHPFTFVDKGDHIVVVIKAKEGVTNALMSKTKAAGGSTDILVLVEGPYGDSAPISKYDRSLFVCGGSGIPGPLSYMLNLPRPHMLLVIVARDLDIIRAFKEEITTLPESNVLIYITKPAIVHGSINDVDFDGRKNVIRGRRPDISTFVQGFLNTGNSLAVTCCGPPALVDMTRDITAAALRHNATKCIAYFEEYQTW